MLDRLDDLSSAREVDLSGDALTQKVISAITAADILSAGGTHGNPHLGEPIQYDYLRIEHEEGVVEITVYNRAIVLFKTGDPLYPKFHRVFGAIEPNQTYGRRPG